MKGNDIIVLLAFAIGIVALYTIPVSSDSRDIYIDASIHQPLWGNPYFVGVLATSQPHTILTPPFSLGDIFTSGKIKVVATAGIRQTTVLAPNIWRESNEDVRLVLKDVMNYESKVTLQLYDNEVLVQTYEVMI